MGHLKTTPVLGIWSVSCMYVKSFVTGDFTDIRETDTKKVLSHVIFEPTLVP